MCFEDRSCAFEVSIDLLSENGLISYFKDLFSILIWKFCIKGQSCSTSVQSATRSPEGRNLCSMVSKLVNW